MDFPNSPVDEQQYTYAGRTWEWDATAGVWNMVPVSTTDADYAAAQATAAAASAAQAEATLPVYAATAPLNPSPGHEWIDSDTGRIYTWIEDGDSGQWVETGAVTGFGVNGVRDAVLADLASEDAGEGASLVALEQGGTVQDAVKWVTPEMFGAVDSDTADNGIALQASATAAAGGTWMLTRTKYTTSKEIIVPPNVRVAMSAGFCEIDGSSITSEDAPNSSILFFGGGSEAELPALAANLARQTNSVEFVSAHGLVAGDRFFVYNPTDSSFSGFRPNYRAGEWCQVLEVIDSTELKTVSPLYADYDSSDVVLYKPEMSTYSFSGKLSVRTSGNNFAVRGVRFRRVCDTDISGLSSFCHQASSAIFIDQCIGINGRGINATQVGISGLGTDYGLSISNSQDCEFHGSFSANRHGVTHGGSDGIGAVPCRNIRVFGTAATTGSVLGVLAMDWHGNSEHCYFNGLVLGGCNPGGNNNTFKGTIVSNADGLLVYCTEWLGHNFDFSGVRFVSYRSNSAIALRGAFDIGGSQTTLGSNTVYGGTLDLSNTKWTIPGTDSVAAFNWRNRGATPASPFMINLGGAVFEETNLGLTNLIRINKVSGDDPASVILTGVESDQQHPMSVVATRIVGPTQAGVTSITTSTSSNVALIAVTFDRTFPRVPAVSLGLNHRTDGTNLLGASAENITTTGFNLRIFTLNEANFSQNIARAVSWTAATTTKV